MKTIKMNKEYKVKGKKGVKNAPSPLNLLTFNH